MEIDHSAIKKAVLKSQRCQRNWDLSKDIPEKDLDLLVTAVTQCPSKQNIAYYSVHFVLERRLIEKIHDQTKGFVYDFETQESVTNSQVLANLLVVFESTDVQLVTAADAGRNVHTYELKNGGFSADSLVMVERDRNMAVGIAAGYLNLCANMMGYATGCCACFDPSGVQDILGLSQQPVLLMGIGFKNEAVMRRVHHKDHSFVFPTKSKQSIQVSIRGA